MTTSPRITSIIGTYYLSNDSEKIVGKLWYHNAHEVALDLSGKYPVSVIKTAGVIAALSPNNRWNRNLHDANAVLNAFYKGGPSAALETTVCTYGAMLKKAITILELSKSTVEDVETILNGQKIVAFFKCLLGSQTAVCVDGHAYAIWRGETIRTTQTPSIGKTLYTRISADYTEAASLISSHERLTIPLHPPQLQAITWLTYKRLFTRW